MPKINIRHPTKYKPQDAFDLLVKYCGERLILKALGNAPPEVKWNTKHRKGSFQVMGVEGVLSVDSGTSATITVLVELPFLMTPLKGVIEKSIRDHLEKLG